MGGKGSKPSSPAGSPKAVPPRAHAPDPVPVAPPTPTREPPAPAKPAPAAAPKADPRWAEVSARYARIFDRLDALEKRALPTPTGNPREPASNSRRDDTCDAARHILNDLVGTRGAPVGCATFMRVPSCYYDEPLEFRRECVGGASVDHMCKTIVMENTKCVNDDTADRANSRWYLVVVQYTAKLNQQKLQKYLHELNNRDGRKCGKKNFHMRLAKEEDSERLTGYVKGAVCPFGCVDAKMPVIFSDKITRLAPDTFWLGAGEVDLKIGALRRRREALRRGHHVLTQPYRYNDELRIQISFTFCVRAIQSTMRAGAESWCAVETDRVCCQCVFRCAGRENNLFGPLGNRSGGCRGRARVASSFT